MGVRERERIIAAAIDNANAAPPMSPSMTRRVGELLGLDLALPVEN